MGSVLRDCRPGSGVRGGCRGVAGETREGRLGPWAARASQQIAARAMLRTAELTPTV